MASAGLIILVLLICAFACGKAGSGGMALVFVVAAVVVFINTPAGSGVPAAVGHFVDGVNNAATPPLNGTGRANR